MTAAGLGAGAFLLFTNPSESGRRTTIAVLPNPAGVGVGLWSTF